MSNKAKTYSFNNNSRLPSVKYLKRYIDAHFQDYNYHVWDNAEQVSRVIISGLPAGATVGKDRYVMVFKRVLRMVEPRMKPYILESLLLQE